MAVAGFCSACDQNVYITEQWGCVNGHPWDQVRDWYDTDTGAPVTPYWRQPGYSPAPPAAAEPAPAAPVAAAAPAAAPAVAPAAASSRTDLLAVILETLSRYPGYRVKYGTDTDIVIDNQLADASWVGGKKRIEYSAVLKAVEPERTVYFWEALKESGAGISLGGFESESYSTFGTTRSGTTKQVVLGPDGVEVDAAWDSHRVDRGAPRLDGEDGPAQGGREVVGPRRG
jgi:hypothetical protein